MRRPRDKGWASRVARAALALAALAALALAVSLGGCPDARTRAPEPDPAAAVVAYRDALAQGRPADAFALIHPSAREGLDLEGFQALYRRHRDTLIAQAEGLVARVGRSAPRERATVAVGRGVAQLVRTREGWRLSRPVGGVDE